MGMWFCRMMCEFSASAQCIGSEGWGSAVKEHSKSYAEATKATDSLPLDGVGSDIGFPDLPAKHERNDVVLDSYVLDTSTDMCHSTFASRASREPKNAVNRRSRRSAKKETIAIFRSATSAQRRRDVSRKREREMKMFGLEPHAETCSQDSESVLECRLAEICEELARIVAFDYSVYWDDEPAEWSDPSDNIGARTYGECPVCMDDSELLSLDCQHSVCVPCLAEQLEARWPGPRVSFGYLNCPLCRVPMSHMDLENMIAAHRRLKNRVQGIALRHFAEDGLEAELCKALGRPATTEEVSEDADKKMAVYMCYDCKGPYCGGRVECAEQQDLLADQLSCRECEWSKVVGVENRRCLEHGHRYAIFKCDSCCSPATWNCVGHHYCDRCHNNPCEDKDYPCPGPGLCPLGIAHPINAAANLDDVHRLGNHRSFVLGCMKCQGFGDYADTDMTFSEENQF